MGAKILMIEKIFSRETTSVNSSQALNAITKKEILDQIVKKYTNELPKKSFGLEITLNTKKFKTRRKRKTQVK